MPPTPRYIISLEKDQIYWHAEPAVRELKKGWFQAKRQPVTEMDGRLGFTEQVNVADIVQRLGPLALCDISCGLGKTR
jgi:hypothetical protein